MPLTKKLILVICGTFLFITLFIHYQLSKVTSEDHQKYYNDDFTVRKMLGLLDTDDESISGAELKHRIEELLRIKSSVQKELRGLEEKRNDLLKQISQLDATRDDLKDKATKETHELAKLRMNIEQAYAAQKELAERNTPELRPPLRLRASPKDNFLAPPYHESQDCTLGTCLDFARCPLSSGFPVYFYNNVYGWTSTKDGYGYLTTNPDEACLFVVSYHDQVDLQSLTFWKGDGRNHILIDINMSENNGTLSSRIEQSGKAMIASSQIFDIQKPRPGFDIPMPNFKYFDQSSDLWSKMPNLVPIRRKYLITYQESVRSTTNPLQAIIEEPLNLINDDKTTDKVIIDFHCKQSGDMGLCGTYENRQKILLKSTFALVLDTSKPSELFLRMSEALENSAIPVFLCLHDCLSLQLPLNNVVDYTKFALFVPASRISELHFLLRSYPDSDLFNLKRQGRLIWQNYFGSAPSIMKSILNLVRTRIGLPAAPMSEETSEQIFNENFRPLQMDVLPSENEPNESLGPLEPPMPSNSYRRNYTFSTNQHDTWNTHFMEFARLPPYTPYEPMLPTEAKFLGSSIGFRAINSGEGGSGKEFSQALGGNYPSEQFTIVMLTYEREAVLMESLSRLYGLPYLNKVIVVWNSEIPPSPDLRWPEIGVPIHVLKTKKNSLNNRFLPYDNIETEAILSVDDDAHLRHDEIIFGFRVWRENRHRLVGFPGRFHAWDQEHLSWNYNSNYSCELSMVLTGAAFYHKYYSYAYSQFMPQAIRDKVDEFMNCEDLAMNFLISHMTREAPVKVTSRWTFRCPGCPITLSEDDSHFQERHNCINFFSSVYGYNPLVNTQFRADSVLFKTRIPQDKQKCFKFI